MRCCFGLVPLLLFSAFARADGLADLQASLQRLSGRAPVEVEVVYTDRQEHTAILRPEVREHAGRFHLREDGAGLHVDWCRPLAGATPSKGAAPDTMDEVAEEVDPSALDGLLNQAEELSRLRETAHFEAESRDTFEGGPVRLLTFTRPLQILPQHQGRILRAESTFKIWIRKDGAPLASEAFMDYEGRHSRLYGRIHTRIRVKTVYAIQDQRLVVSSRASEGSIYDTGDRIKQNQTLTLMQKG